MPGLTQRIQTLSGFFKEYKQEKISIMKIFTYTMVWDTGFAPAVHNGLLSLACCETKLRYLIAKEMARDNSSEIILLGLCGKQLASRHTLPNPYYPVYVSKITDFVKCSDYYTLPQYSSRPDCQYEKTGGIERPL